MKLIANWLSDADVKTLFSALTQAGQELRFVGGCVRDSVLGKPFTDLDAASTATPDEAIALLEQAGIRTIPTGISHGTITALVGQRSIEITTLRKDEKTDGRHAQVSFTGDWEEDAARRDFTMNALYVDHTGELFDYHGGVADVKAGIVRFIGDADTRIKEDYLRILRFFRFHAHYAKTAFDTDALRACSVHKDSMVRLSGERISHEMLKLFSAPCASDAIAQMEDVGVLQPLLLSAQQLRGLMRLEQLPAVFNMPLLKLASLIHDEPHVNAIAKRWRLSNYQARQLHQWLNYSSQLVVGLSVAQQKHFRRKWGTEIYKETVMMAYANSTTEWQEFVPFLAVCDWVPPVFPVTGEDLKLLGIAEGKSLGDMLGRLEAVWEASDYALTKQELLSRI
jgi:poly(A) polymerase